MKSGALLALLLSLSPLARAQGVEIDLDSGAAQKMGLDASAAEKDLGDSIESALRVVDQKTFLEGMANANAVAGHGMGVDYSLDVHKLVVGGSLGSGVGGAGALYSRGGKETPLPTGGFSGQLTLMAGIDLGGLLPGEKGFLDRIRLFANGMMLEMPSGAPFGGSMENIGGHIQIQIVDGPEVPGFGWRGIALTSGYEHTGYHLRLEKNLPVVTDSGGVDLSWDASGSYDVDCGAETIPIEVSTALHVFVVGVFLGGGYDILASEASSAAALGGSIAGDGPDGDVDLGSASLSLEDSATGDTSTMRLFVGAQVRVILVKVYGQVNVADNDTVGGHFGVRAAW